MAAKVKVGKTGANAGWWRVRDAVKNGQEFTNTNGTFRGEHGPARGMWSTGQLFNEYRDSVAEADYVIYSYGTPIAWRVGGEWITPDTRYSMTTSHHQGKAFTAVRNLD